jgi:dimethylargininase
MLIAVTRGVSERITECALTHLVREPIDLQRAGTQHRQYENLLAELGCKLIKLPPEPELPDSVFVEDAAVVLDEVAIITRPGAESRRPETAAVTEVLKKYRKLIHIESPGTLDGGDVLQIGKSLYVGLSQRSNQSGIDQLRRILSAYGYSVTTVELRDCLHLKSAVTQVASSTLLINRRWVDDKAFGEMRFIEVALEEPFAANAVRVGETLIFPASFPKTLQRLEIHGIEARTVDTSELAKAEGGVTCCSLIFSDLANPI